MGPLFRFAIPRRFDQNGFRGRPSKRHTNEKQAARAAHELTCSRNY